MGSGDLTYEVMVASSGDDRFPATNLNSGSEKQFWISTGMFPQEILLRFVPPPDVSDPSTSGTPASSKVPPPQVTLTKIKTWTRDVRHLVIERTADTQPINFEPMVDVDLNQTAPRQQVESYQVNSQLARFLKIKLLSGWSDFPSISKVVLEGSE